MIDDDAARFLMQQTNETIRFLVEQKTTYVNSIINVCMLWWVSSVVFYGSVLAAVWLKQKELKEHRFILNLLGLTLSVLFLSTAAFGLLVIRYSFQIQGEIDTLVDSLKGPDNFFDTELSGFRRAMGFGIGSFLLITLIWIWFWCHLREVSLKSGLIKFILWTLRRNKKREETTMRIEKGEVRGNLEIKDEFTLLGTAKGNINVRDGGVLELNGTCEGDLILEEGSTVRLNGTVNGDVYNRGGKLKVYGIIKGRLHKEAGETFVDDKAEIRPDAV
ncbi:MAG TPA: polymer-forming cytoskeletal protein [Pyrinomonadaceae bacterium]|jgi:cytoskeletal protein CcmA (bactofilin family)